MSHPVTNSLRSLLANRASRLATLWKIARTDGREFRFTDHNASITFESASYTPIASMNASARQAVDGLRDQNLEVIGVIDSPNIRESDLRGGRFREAKVTEYLVDWQTPWAGAFVTNCYWLVETSWTGEVWKGSLSGRTKWLDQPVGDVYGPGCRRTLGDSGCQVDIDSFEVVTVVHAGLVDPTRKAYSSTSLGLFDDGYFDDGRAYFVSGENRGLVGEVKRHEGDRVRFQLPMPFDINFIDIIQIRPGCPKTLQGCYGTDGTAGRPWPNNIVRFGGYPFLPGSTRVLKTPRAK